LEKELIDERTRRESAEAKLIGVQAKFDEVKAQMERETAEMRQRLMKTLEDRAKQGQFNFLTTLLPVLDNLNLAISASEKDSSFEHLLSGVKGTARSFEQALMNVGVETVPSIGAEFNPELHEAIDWLKLKRMMTDALRLNTLAVISSVINFYVRRVFRSARQWHKRRANKQKVKSEKAKVWLASFSIFN